MKKIIMLSQFVVLANLASCEEAAKVRCKVNIHVTDDAGIPVEDAQVSARYPVGIKVNPGGGFPTDRHETSRVQSDSKGNAVLEYDTVSTPEGLIWIKKNGFYESIYSDQEWKPAGPRTWNSDVSAILKPIKNPIPMHAYDNTGGMEKIANIPEFDREYGFDLMMAQALPPLGKGEVADFTFTINGHHHGNSHYDMALKVRFNNPEDGVVEFLTPQRLAPREPINTGSLLISGYEAPETGYVRDIERRFKRGGIETKRESNVDFRRNFYFRTRTKTDPEGRIISAHYGKIYGDFQFSAANKDWGYVATLALLTTYFNPSPNDRNVEFDPKRNLHPEGKVLHP